MPSFLEKRGRTFFKRKNMKLVIIIPSYNEQDSVTKVIKLIPKKIDGIDKIKIVVIDDGSTDETIQRVKSQTKAIIISHKKNQGVGFAFQTGIDYALRNKADIVTNIDADGQFNPIDIPKLIKPILDKKADFVTGSRFIKKEFIPKMPEIKYWGNRQVSRLISWLLKEKFYDVSCGFRAYNKKALLNLNLFGKFTYTQETFLDLSFKNLRIKEVPIQVRYFKKRKSRIYQNAFHYAFNISRIIFETIRDYQPLRFFGFIGLFIFSIGLVLNSFMLGFYLYTGGFTPYKFIGLAGIVLNVMGLSVIILALVANMLYRIRINQEKLLYYTKKRYYYSKR